VREEYGLALRGTSDARMIEIDMEHRLVTRQSDQEGAAPRPGRNVARRPACAVEEEIFVAIEAKDRLCLEQTVRIALEQDRIVALCGGEFGKEQRHLVDRVAISSAEPAGYPEIGVDDIIETRGAGHRDGTPKPWSVGGRTLSAAIKKGKAATPPWRPSPFCWSARRPGQNFQRAPNR